MKQIKIPWDKYEVALLIETYLKIQRGEVSRTDGLKNLSSMLRAKSLHEGKIFDSYFRNYNGMCFMINSIANTFHPNKYSIHGSNLFTDMVNMYKTDIDEFNVILNEAYSLVNNSEVIRTNTSLENSNIKEQIDCFEYRTILNKYFEEGFSYNNPIQKRKFIRLYSEEIGKNFVDTDDIYLEKIKKSGFVCENRIYPLSIVSDELKNEIQKYIETNLNNDFPLIYYNSLFAVFRSSLGGIFDENMFKAYVTLAFKDKYNFGTDFISIKGQDVDLRQYVIDLFIESGKPINKDEIYRELPNISREAIDDILKDKDFVLNIRGKSYFYIGVFNINDSELKDIELFIGEKIAEKEQLVGSELYEYVQEYLPNVIESNPEVTDLGIRNAIKEHLRDKFRFKGDVISGIDNRIDIKVLYKNFCESHERVTFEELENFRDSIRQSYIDYDAVFSKMIRINQTQFVRRDLINFDIESIDNAILKYCVGEFISFNDIINYTDFPSVRYVWNNYVLESYVYSYSKKFKLIHATFNKEKPVGGIVKYVSKIETFDDLLTRIIKDNKLFEREKAFGFLLDNNIIMTRRVKNIGILIDKAKQEV